MCSQTGRSIALYMSRSLNHNRVSSRITACHHQLSITINIRCGCALVWSRVLSRAIPHDKVAVHTSIIIVEFNFKLRRVNQYELGFEPLYNASPMFKSKKLKKVANAANVSSVTNVIKNVGSADLSAGLGPKSFGLDCVNKFGIFGNIVGIAFDPIQSLLALSTDTGEIHVFGQQQVEYTFNVRTTAPITNLKFVKGIYLVAIDTKDTIMVFSIYSKKLLYSLTAPGRITAIETDPSLDWLLLGLQNGSIIVYDIDRGQMTAFKVDNLQKQILPKEKLSPVISLQWNPRDMGTLLVAYSKSVIIYSLPSDAIKQSFIYELEGNAFGGNYMMSRSKRAPGVLQALYHPNSLNIVSLYDDGSIVFWDALTGELILARSLFDTDVDAPQQPQTIAPLRNTQFRKAAWLCEENPDVTSLMIAGGDAPEKDGIHNLTVFDFGAAPTYSITSYDKMNKYYSEPKQQRFLPIQNKSSIVDFLPLAQSSPFFGGCHNPNYIFLLLQSGEIEILEYPSGKPSYKSSLFPQSIAWVHPHTTCTVATAVPRKQWLGMISRGSNTKSVLQGGFPNKRALTPNEVRSALATGHSNGSIRMSDASHEDLGDTYSIDIDVSAALNTIRDVEIDHISFAGETAELAVATLGGDVALFKFDVNRRYNPSVKELEIGFQRFSLQDEKRLLVDLSSRTPNVPEGFLPVVAIHARKGRITALKNSSIGFVVVAYQRGELMIIDRRGPAIIFFENIAKYSRSGSNYVTAVEFSIMAFGDDAYSSILLFAGTNTGELLTFKILPESSGRFSAELVDIVQTNDYEVTNIQAFKTDTGLPIITTFEQFNLLSSGELIRGSVMISSSQDIRILIPAKAKQAHRGFNNTIFASGISVVSTRKSDSAKPYGSVVATFNAKGVIKIYSLPDLKEITSMTTPYVPDPQFGKYSNVLPSGDIVIRITSCEAALVTIAGTGKDFQQDTPIRLYNENLTIPYRPQVGTMQWAKGTIFISYQDLDSLLGGPRRLKSKYPESEIAQGNVTLISKENKEDANAKNQFAYQKPVRKRTSGGYDPTRYIYRQFQNGIDSAEEAFNEYANGISQNMNESIGAAKEDLIKSMVKSKFGF